MDNKALEERIEQLENKINDYKEVLEYMAEILESLLNTNEQKRNAAIEALKILDGE